MRPSCRALFLFLLVACLSAPVAYDQDSPSLGDAARQARQQKQKQPAKDSQGEASTPSKVSKVITNDEIPEHSGAPVTPDDQTLGRDDLVASSGRAKISAEQWKAQIQAQKSRMRFLQSDIDRFNDSIHFAPGNCVANCVQWNERQKEKQAKVERMRAQLEDQKKRLEDMQESARQQGYGSSVYDP